MARVLKKTLQQMALGDTTVKLMFVTIETPKLIFDELNALVDSKTNVCHNRDTEANIC